MLVWCSYQPWASRAGQMSMQYTQHNANFTQFSPLREPALLSILLKINGNSFQTPCSSAWGTEGSSLLLSKELWIIPPLCSHLDSSHSLYRVRYLKNHKILKMCSTELLAARSASFLKHRSWPFACCPLPHPLSSWLFKHMDMELLTFTGKTNKIMLRQERSDVSLQLAPLICGNLISARVAELPGKVLPIK